MSRRTSRPTASSRKRSKRRPTKGTRDAALSRLAGRRRVEDHLPLPPLGDDLEQALDRHVLEHPGEAARQVPVVAVAEDAVARRLVGRVAGDQAVEGAAGVEQAGVEARWRATPARAAGGGEAREVDRHLAVARRLADPERVLEPQRRVEGHDQRVAARTPAAGRRAVAQRRDDAERRRERGLADAARADDDHQRVAVGDQLHDPSPVVVR
jgi:hypothetical protein